jgi:hypothetical protein
MTLLSVLPLIAIGTDMPLNETGVLWEGRGTFPINGSRPQDYPRRWASSRVHCIGLLAHPKATEAFNSQRRSRLTVACANTQASQVI